MTASSFNFCLNISLYIRLAILTYFDLKIVHLAVIGHLYIGNTFRCTGLAPASQMRIILSLAILTLIEGIINL